MCISVYYIPSKSIDGWCRIIIFSTAYTTHIYSSGAHKRAKYIYSFFIRRFPFCRAYRISLTALDRIPFLFVVFSLLLWIEHRFVQRFRISYGWLCEYSIFVSLHVITIILHFFCSSFLSYFRLFRILFRSLSLAHSVAFAAMSCCETRKGTKIKVMKERNYAWFTVLHSTHTQTEERTREARNGWMSGCRAWMSMSLILCENEDKVDGIR